MNPNSQKIIIIAGPTASGKSELAVRLAKDAPSVIINADSMQVYREIPILSAQPGAAERAETPHALYGFISAQEEFSTGRWLELAKSEIDKAHRGKIIPIVVGGTGLYLKSLIEGIAEIPDINADMRTYVRNLFVELGKEKFHEYLRGLDAAAAEKIRASDKQRMLRAAEVMLQTGESILYWQNQTKPNYPKEYFEISKILPERTELYRRCDARFLQMLENSALAEAAKLRDMKLPDSAMAMKALGARELISHLNGEIPLNEAIKKAQQMTRNYAKRQYTWFRNSL